jgi:cell division protein FtsL
MAVPARKLRQAPQRRPQLRPVRQPAPSTRRPVPPKPRAVRRHRRRTPFALLCLVVVTALVVTLASAHAIVAQQAFRVAELTTSLERLEEGHGRLRLKVAEMTSPGRLARAARKAGLVLPPPEEVQILQIDPARPGSGTGGTDEGAGGVTLPDSGSGPVLAQGVDGENG